MLRPSHSFSPPAAMFCLCCANNFLHNQIALDLGTLGKSTQKREERENTLSLLIYISSPMKAGILI